MLLKLVQEHGVQLVILHSFNLTREGVNHQIRIDPRHLLSDQAVLDPPRAIGEGLLVPERHGPKPEQAAARLAHIVDLLLVAPRRGKSAELTSGVDEHGRARFRCAHAADPLDEGARVDAQCPDPDGVRFGFDTRVVQINIEASRCLAGSCPKSNGGVVVPGDVALERTGPDGGVGDSGSVVYERRAPAGGVVEAGGVAEERKEPAGGVETSGGVAVERSAPAGGVGASGGVAPERTGPAGGVGASDGVALERTGPAGGVGASGGVALERTGPAGGVGASGGVAGERISPAGGVEEAGGVAGERAGPAG